MKQIRSPPLCTDKQHFGVWIPAGEYTVHLCEIDILGPLDARILGGIDNFIPLRVPLSIFRRGKALQRAFHLIEQNIDRMVERMYRRGKRRGVCQTHVRQLIHCRMSIQPCDCNIENRIHLVRPQNLGPKQSSGRPVCDQLDKHGASSWIVVRLVVHRRQGANHVVPPLPRGHFR